LYSEVLLSSEAQIITYVNKLGERSEHFVQDIAYQGREDIAKRLKYAKDIMYRLITPQPPQQASSSSSDSNNNRL